MHKTKSTISSKAENISAWSTFEQRDHSSSPSSAKFYGEKLNKKKSGKNLFKKLNTSNNDIDHTSEKVEYFEAGKADRKLRSADNKQEDAFDKDAFTNSMSVNDDLVQSDEDECIVFEDKFIAKKDEENVADDGLALRNVVIISSSSNSDDDEELNTARSKKQKHKKFINKFKKKQNSEGKDGSIIYFSTNSHRQFSQVTNSISLPDSSNLSGNNSSILIREPCLIFDPESDSDFSKESNQLTVPQLFNLCTICTEKEIDYLMIDFREYESYRHFPVPNFYHYTDYLEDSQENLEIKKISQASLVICLINYESKFNSNWELQLKNFQKQYYSIKFPNQKYYQSLLTNHFTSINESFLFMNGEIIWLMGDRFLIKQQFGYVITDDSDTLSALATKNAINSYVIDSEFIFGNETKFLNLLLNLSHDNIKPLIVTCIDKNLEIAIILILLMVLQNYSLYTALLYLRYITCGSYLSKEKSTTYPPNPFKKEKSAKFMDKLKKIEALLFGKTVSKKKVKEEMGNNNINLHDVSFELEMTNNQAVRRN